MMDKMGPKTAVALTDKTFNKFVQETELTFVLYYTRSCEHCQRFSPEFEKAARKLGRIDKSYKLATIACEGDNRDICDTQGVEMFPVVQIFKDGFYRGNYEGAAMTKEGIIDEYLESLRPPCIHLTDIEEIKTVLTENKRHSIVYFDIKSDAKTKEQYEKIAIINYRFNKWYTIKEMKTVWKARQAGIDIPDEWLGEIVFFKMAALHVPWEQNIHIYGNKANNKKVTDGLVSNWIDEKRMGKVPWITGGDWQHKKIKWPRIVAFYDLNFELDIERSNEIRTRLYQYAKKHPQIQFAVAHFGEFSPLWAPAEDLFKDRISVKKFREWSVMEPRIVAFPGDNEYYQDKTYPFEQKLTEDNLEPFIEKLKKNQLQNYIKSEPIPEKDDHIGNITKIVARNFDEKVWDNPKDKFLMMHVPWCHHCRLLRPVWFQVAEYYKNDPNIEFQMFNLDENAESFELNVQGYPSLYWIPKGANKDNTGKAKFQFYKGDRDKDGLIEFIEDNATVQPTITGELIDDDVLLDNEGAFFTPAEIAEQEREAEANRKMEDDARSEGNVDLNREEQIEYLLKKYREWKESQTKGKADAKLKRIQEKLAGEKKGEKAEKEKVLKDEL